jgi:hypothetical protein
MKLLWIPPALRRSRAFTRDVSAQCAPCPAIPLSRPGAV